VPTTFVGLVLFVVFLTPGFVLLLVQEARRPKRKYSTLRETAVLLLGGVVFMLLVLGLFAVLHLLFPDITPDIGRIVRDRDYLKREYDAVLLWTVGLVALASILAGLGGLLDRPPTKWLRDQVDRFRPIKFQSAWFKMFDEYLRKELAKDPNRAVYCGCTLSDGTWMGGYLFSFSTDVEEGQDRDLVLTGDISMRLPDKSASVTRLENVGGVIISARQLASITVSYVPKPQ